MPRDPIPDDVRQAQRRGLVAVRAADGQSARSLSPGPRPRPGAPRPCRLGAGRSAADPAAGAGKVPMSALRQFRGPRASDLFPVLAYATAEGLFLLDDASLAFGFLCQPLPAGDQGEVDRLSVLLSS